MTVTFNPSKYKTSQWYDNYVIPNEDTINYKPPFPKHTGWDRRNPILIDMMDLTKPVFDVGCGIGIMGAMLWHSGHKAKYTGVDFCESWLNRAILGNAKDGHQNAEWYNKDILDPDLFDLMLPNSIVILSEVLEHVVDDIELLKRVPNGTPMIITVPWIDDDSHVRIFPSVFDAGDRYQPYVNIQGLTAHGGGVSHILWGTSNNTEGTK